MRVNTLLQLPRTVRNMRRLREIVAVLLRHGFGEVVDQLDLHPWVSFFKKLRFWEQSDSWTNRTIEARIRLSLEELGPTFVKLGQVLASRPDLVPMGLVVELRKLQDDVPPFGLDDVHRVIHEDLGSPLDEIFTAFSEEPIAAASIAQVHLATLHDGREVVVKVQRPELRRVIDGDLQILEALAGLMHQRIPEIRRFDFPGIVREFAAALKLESDFTNERSNMDRFARIWADEPMVNSPVSYPKYCSQRVLTMEFVKGFKVTDREKLKALNIEPIEIARRGTMVALRGVFEHGFFHADPHPGNFFILQDGGITLIDFGMMGVLDRQRIDELLSFLVSILINDPDMMVRLFLELDIIEETTNMRALKREIKTLIDRYYSVPLGEIDLGRFITQIFEVVTKHDVRLPPDLLLVGKSLTVMEGIAQEVEPSYDPVAEVRPYLLRTYVMRVLDPAHHAREIAKQAADYALLLKQLPAEARSILKKVRRGQIRVTTVNEGQAQLLASESRRTNRVVSAALSGISLLCGTALYMGDHTTESFLFLGIGGLWFAWSWLGVLRSGGT